jgi:UDP-glucuronate 4-epimerase
MIKSISFCCLCIQQLFAYGKTGALMRTVIVTGAAGFIGSHVTERLLKSGYKVAGIDNFNDFYCPQIKRNNINTIKHDNSTTSNFELFEGDICDNKFVQKTFEKTRPAAVIHLAAYVGVRPSIESPALYTKVNVDGLVNILEATKINNVKRFVFASSSAVYGNNKKLPFSESDSVDNPISPYAATKKAGELICHTYNYLYNISFACLRFFTVYGPRQRPDLAIHKFTKLIDEGKPIPFFGDGDTERDYTYIDDITCGVIQALEWTFDSEKSYEIFNLGESKTISLSEMVAAIEKALGKKAIIQKMPPQLGDISSTCADISKARRILGYNPQTNFEEGLNRFVKWFKTNKN